MYNEEQNKVNPTDSTTADVNYVEIIDELKRNTVSKDQYLKVVNEHKDLLAKFINNEKIEDNSSEQSYSLDELKEKMNRHNVTNLEYADAALKLRAKVIEETGQDPFLPYGHKVNPTNADIEAANRVAQILQECIDDSEGDSRRFQMELERRII